MTRLLQIVPHLPPPNEGVGDYALALARALAGMGIATTFLVPGPERPESGRIPVRALPVPSSEALAAALAAWSNERPEDAAVLVHYANYAYERRGCPEWLVGGLLRWRSRAGRTRLLSFFHEVYASGPPWRRSFWLSPTQRRLAAALARASDRVATSLELYRDLLARWVPAEAIAILPVLSNVGELAAPVPLAARRRRLVVFGGHGTRARAYGKGGGALAAACAALGIEEIADIGPESGVQAAPGRVAGIAVARLGELPAAAVSARLAESLAGFVVHREEFLGKSGVFAAYCAHGMLPVAGCGGSAGLAWAPSAEASDTCDSALQTRADAAFSWYAGHSLARQAEAFRALLGAAGA
jgi:hypothetical protein